MSIYIYFQVDVVLVSVSQIQVRHPLEKCFLLLQISSAMEKQTAGTAHLEIQQFLQCLFVLDTMC